MRPSTRAIPHASRNRARTTHPPCEATQYGGSRNKRSALRSHLRHRGRASAADPRTWIYSHFAAHCARARARARARAGTKWCTTPRTGQGPNDRRSVPKVPACNLVPAIDQCRLMTHRRLQGDPHSDPSTVFSWSCQPVPDELAFRPELFRSPPPIVRLFWQARSGDAGQIALSAGVRDQRQ